jgi:hypothetical protein
MKWTKPKLHDLRDLKEYVAQGACAVGDTFGGADCTAGSLADNTCVAGALQGQTGCSPGSAV